MTWYQGEGSPEKYDEHFDKWLPMTRRQAENPWPYKIMMAEKCNGLVLDAGCGYGCLARFIKDGLFLDFSKVALKKRWVGGERPRICASVENMPFRDVVFDSVIATEVMEHIDNPKNFVSEVHRTLKACGFFAFSSPWRDNSATHKWKEITEEMVNEWLNPFFTDYKFDVPRQRKERFMVYAYK